MKIFMLAIGARERASSRLRVWDHVDALRAAGHDVVVDSVVGAGRKANDLAFLARLLRRLPSWVRSFFHADAIVLQETMLLAPLVPLRNIARHRHLVFDFSDAVDRMARRRWMRAVRRLALQFITSRADAVVIENGRYFQALPDPARVRKFYGPVNVTAYQASRLDIPVSAEDGAVRIGWTGSPGTFHFIAPLLPLIDEIARDRPIELMLIGIERCDIELKHAKLVVVPWTEAGEMAAIPTFDLGLFRIDDSEDARWRGAGKLFIYLAASVPFVATDAGIAHDVMRESGIGFPVGDSPNDWSQALRRAVEDSGKRHSFRAAAGDYARGNLSYERYRCELLDLLAPSAHDRPRP